ncbi:MAG: single-stranded DNA-binding protein, partial [Eubacterium sp.]
NNVMLIGRLTKDPQVRYTSGNMAVASFTLAIDRPAKKGEDHQADFPRVIVFGKQAESCGRYLFKGMLTAVSGRIQTGQYQNQKGETVYTTDVVANRVEFLEWRNDNSQQTGQSHHQNNYQPTPSYSQDPQGYYNSTYQNPPQQRQASGGQQQTMQAPPSDSDPSGQFEAVDEDVPF